MARPDHLTAGDLRFLASVERDTVRKLDAIIDLGGELLEAAEASGVEPDLSALEGIEDDETLADPQRLDGIRADLRGQLGRVGRGEVAPRDERAGWNAEMLRQAAELRADMGTDAGHQTTEESTDE